MGKVVPAMAVSISWEDYETMKRFYETMQEVSSNQSASPGLFGSSAPTIDDSDVPIILCSSQDDDKEIPSSVHTIIASFVQDGEPGGGSPGLIPSPEYFTDESIAMLSINLDSDSLPDWIVD
ncbi:hypothetical protein FS749_001208 [Ceratobasidium sp. UAMH 11750]|nr:hypothetical protein FS749_001208 [Ceratobasidium sp. UAMH 11750]